MAWRVGFVKVEGKSPGPCAYDVFSFINPVGKYVNSRMKNSLAQRFGPAPNCSRNLLLFDE